MIGNPPPTVAAPDGTRTRARLCRACGRARPLAELLIVRRRDRPEISPWFVCRPGIYLPGDPLCFGRVGPAFVETIAFASTIADEEET